MHELSIVKRILEMALEVSRDHGDQPVERVEVQVGVLRQVVPESMLFAFEAACRGTLAEGAVFEWSKVPAEVICERCEAVFHPEFALWVCPACGAGGGRIVAGDELLVSSVTLRDEHG